MEEEVQIEHPQYVSNPQQSFSNAARQTPQILCPMCGISFNPGISKTNVCLQCLSSSSDISVGITKEGVLNFCRQCRRYLRNNQWILCERESKELLAICLKRIRGLNKVKIIDAAFIWTEEHSRRVKIKLTIQKEVANNVNVQESFAVEFYEHFQQCDECKKEFTHHTWGAMVQVRQYVTHKRTFFYLEQLILKHSAHDRCIKIQESTAGLDFYYKNRTHAMRLVDFLQTVFAVKIKVAKQLVSQDANSNTYNYKYTFSVELPKVCKDDLVFIPNKLRQQLGGVSNALLCYKVTNSIRFLDPKTSRFVDFPANLYFQHEVDMTCISLKENATDFMVVNTENDYFEKKRNQPGVNTSQTFNNTSFLNSQAILNRTVDVEVSRMTDWQNFRVKSYLGDILREGAVIKGFDLTTLNVPLDNVEMKELPEIVLVKKVNPNKQNKKRLFRLKRMDIEDADENAHKKQKKNDDKHRKEFEEFLDDIEDEQEMRNNINLYRDEDNIKIYKEEKLRKRQNNMQSEDGQKPKPRREQKKILKVRGVKGGQQNIEIKAKKEVDDKKVQQTNENDEWEDIDDDEDDGGIRLAELLTDLKLDDKEEAKIKDDNEDIVNEFINKLEKVKIEKD